MRGFELVKREDHWALYNEDGHKIAATLPGCKSKLSIKNCEAITNGYDLDELAEKATNKQLIRILGGEDKEEVLNDIQKRKFYFIEGAKAILEILGDKKFNYGHLDKMFTCGKLYQDSRNNAYSFDNVLSKFEQTEWDVEIVMETPSATYGHSGWHKQPKLDKEGCLILKRI